MQVRSICTDMLQVCIQIDKEKENMNQEAVTTIIDFQPL